MWVARPRYIIIIAFDFLLITVITFLSYARSRVNRFWSFFAWVMTFLFLINIIAMELLWYVIPLLRSCPREIRLESDAIARATLCNLILSLLASGNKTVLFSSVQMTCPAAVTKLMLLPLVLLKKLQLLHKWYNAHKSKNQVLEPVLVFGSCGFSVTINIITIEPDAKDFGSGFLLFLSLDAA